MTNEGDYDPILQFGMIKDGSAGVEHNPVWGNIYKDVLKFYSSSGTYLTPTLQVCYGVEMGKEYFKYKFWHYPDRKLLAFSISDTTQKRPTSVGAESIETIVNAHPMDTICPAFLLPARIDERLWRSGTNLALGSHGNDLGIGAHNEIWALQMGGISNFDALRIATINGAKAIGVQQDVGSIEVGKIADLLILNGDPLKDIHNTRDINYVMKDGILYEGNTLNEIWPAFVECPVWRKN
jgi:hypothetical protein